MNGVLVCSFQMTLQFVRACHLIFTDSTIEIILGSNLYLFMTFPFHVTNQFIFIRVFIFAVRTFDQLKFCSFFLCSLIIVKFEAVFTCCIVFTVLTIDFPHSELIKISQVCPVWNSSALRNSACSAYPGITWINWPICFPLIWSH